MYSEPAATERTHYKMWRGKSDMDVVIKQGENTKNIAVIIVAPAKAKLISFKTAHQNKKTDIVPSSGKQPSKPTLKRKENFESKSNCRKLFPTQRLSSKKKTTLLKIDS